MVGLPPRRPWPTLRFHGQCARRQNVRRSLLGRFDRKREPGMFEGQRQLADHGMGFASRVEDLRVFAWSKDAMIASSRRRNPHGESGQADGLDDEPVFAPGHALMLTAKRSAGESGRLQHEATERTKAIGSKPQR
jgi:hypothetical protein